MILPVHDQVDDAVMVEGGRPADLSQASAVLGNPKFLALFLAQVLTQVGGNMVLFGLTIQVYSLTGSNTSISLLLLTFLVPAVVFGAIAGVFVDRFDRRLILVGTNVARGLAFVVLVFFSDQLALIYVVTVVVATLTTFFGPAEASMIPILVRREHLMVANGIFIFGLQASFVAGFAVLGPLFQNLMGTEALIAGVAISYLLAAAFCWTLPPAPPVGRGGDTIRSAERAIGATMAQLREGITYIREHHDISWSLTYLTITSSLIGVLGVLGASFVVESLGLTEDDLVIILLPLGAGLVVGILTLVAYGRYLSRRRMIEGGMVVLSMALIVLGTAQRVSFLSDGSSAISLLTVVVAVGFVAGVCYVFVAVPAQTSLQEELPTDVRGRVFGVLNMLISLGSMVPIIIVGPLSDLTGPSLFIVLAALIVGAVGVASMFLAHPAHPGSAEPVDIEPVDPVTVTQASSTLMRPVQLRYLDGEQGASSPIDMVAMPVVPGRAGPASAAPGQESQDAAATDRADTDD